MTAKDFTLIARTIACLSLPVGNSREYIAGQFADNLAQTNPRFDRERFVKVATNG